MLLKQSTAFVRIFDLGTTGLTVNIQLSKAGGALANPNAGASTLTEIGRGLYKFSLATQDTATLGDLAYALTDNATNLTIYQPASGSVDQVVLDLPGATISGDVTLNSLTVTTTTTLTGNVSLGGTLGVTGTTTLAALTTTGTVTLNALTVSNATTLSGNVSLGGTLTVTGATSLAAVSTSGTVTFNAFTVTNATTWSGAVSFGSTFGITGTITYGGSSTAAANAAKAWGGIETGTAQAGGAASITLRAGASATNDFYVGQAIMIVSGAGAGQTNSITAYVGATKVATVETAWAVAVDNTSVYEILGRIN